MLQICYIYHWKGLIFSSYEPDGEGAWRLHVRAMPSWLNLELFPLKRVWPSYGIATPPVLLADRNWVSGLSNEIYNVSEGQVTLEIRAVKVERSKKKPVLLRKSWFFFDRSSFTARIFWRPYVTDKLYTSLKSPNIQLLWARRTKDVASK